MHHSKPLPFLLGAVFDQAGTGNALVCWWLPCLSPAATFKPGAKKKVVDIFAEWTPMDAAEVGSVNQTRLPSIVVPVENLLLWNIELEDGQISFGDFDRLRAEHGIDCTGLSLSTTKRGNQYRAHCLMKRSDE